VAQDDDLEVLRAARTHDESGECGQGSVEDAKHEAPASRFLAWSAPTREFPSPTGSDESPTQRAVQVQGCRCANALLMPAAAGAIGRAGAQRGWIGIRLPCSQIPSRSCIAVDRRGQVVVELATPYFTVGGLVPAHLVLPEPSAEIADLVDEVETLVRAHACHFPISTGVPACTSFRAPHPHERSGVELQIDTYLPRKVYWNPWP